MGVNTGKEALELWFKLTMATSQTEFKPPKYYEDKNVAIIIADNDGFGKDFKLEEVWITRGNRFGGLTKDEEPISLEDTDIAHEKALCFIKKKLNTAELNFLGWD